MKFDDQIDRNVYLRNLALGKLYGPLTDFPSSDKVWLKYYSEEAVESKLPECTIYDYFLESTKKYDDLVALKYYGKKIKYKELKERIDETAKRFIKLGVKEGDIVTLAMPTCPETVYFFYALNKIGAVANFIHPLSNPKEFKHLINEVNTKILIAFDGAMKNINQIIDETSVQRIITCSPTYSMPLFLKEYLNLMNKPFASEDSRYMDYKTFRSLKVDDVIEYRCKYTPDTLAVMTHTSGTTGVPKGAKLTNDNFNSMVHQYRVKAANFMPGDTMVTVLPPLASFMLCNCMNMPLCLGVTVDLVVKYKKENIGKYLARKYKGRVHMMGIPSYFEAMLTDKKMQKANLSKLGYIVVGGGSLEEEKERLINEFLKEHNAKVKITKGYGETEITSSATYTFEDSNKVGSVGIPLLKTNVKIIDIDNNEKELRYNEEGEICFQTPTMFNGYYNNDEETKNVVFTDNNGNRWIKSGDLGYVDRDGILYVTGRIKRLFIVEGRDKSLTKAFPSRIEKTILESKYVDKCVVVSMPHKTMINAVKAYIVLKENVVFNEEVLNDIEKYCVRDLRETLLPHEYDIVEKLPLNAIGKIDLKALEKGKNIDVKIMKKVRN